MNTSSVTVPAAWPSAAEALANRDALLTLLFAWAERDWIRDLDAALAHRLAQLAPEGNASCLLAAMLVSHHAGQGHLLLDLTQAHERPTTLIAVEPEEDSPPTPETLLALLPTPLWLEALHHWSAVDSDSGSHSAQNSPLVLNDKRLYLRRYW
ncbi:MAG: exodeoxyribonuclease V subunit alpha, partial [Halomonadaceae bacterium]|nr:exodeoxyribonuclease V subunit alpha [Halomonadaceae bacterium]